MCEVRVISSMLNASANAAHACIALNSAVLYLWGCGNVAHMHMAVIHMILNCQGSKKKKWPEVSQSLLPVRGWGLGM